jgi:glycosyltransferase involved in cell wall biosynthesis
MIRIAVILSHPIQYYAPWFRYLNHEITIKLKVFYLWNFGVTTQIDPGFQKAFQWDIPLLEGYDYEFIENTSTDPGTHHFWGLQNPELISRVESFSPDAVLLMSYNYASLYHLLWRWNLSPLIFRGDSHRLLASIGIKSWMRRLFIRQLFTRLSACLYVGKANYEYYRYHGVAPENLYFSPHAIDNKRFLPETTLVKDQAIDWKRELGIPIDHQIILFAGKFEEKKRPLDLLLAFLIAKLETVSLLFVGSGELESVLRAKATAQPNIYFAPFQNQRFMPAVYAIADLFVLPSFGAEETWGLAVNEAMCLSCPIITSTHVGCTQDLVHPYENGLVFPAGDIPALAEALREAFSDRDRLKQWGQASQKIISQYSYQQTTQGLIQALNFLGIM